MCFDKSLLLKIKTAAEIKNKMDKHEVSARLIRNIFKWFGNFQHGHILTNDAEHPE